MGCDRINRNLSGLRAASADETRGGYVGSTRLSVCVIGSNKSVCYSPSGVPGEVGNWGGGELAGWGTGKYQIRAPFRSAGALSFKNPLNPRVQVVAAVAEVLST